MCKTGYFRSLKYQIGYFGPSAVFYGGFRKVPQLSNMFIFGPSTIKSIYFFPLTLLEGDIHMT
jgi:hypothetical protein